MIWHKTGRFFHVDQLDLPWARTHTQVPIVLPIGNRLRVWFGTRDEHGHTHTAWIDVSADGRFEALDMCKVPALAPGQRGLFDDCGAMPSCVVDVRGDASLLYLYYTGWSRSVQVPYHLAIGLATSWNGGETFERIVSGPIMDRTGADPYWVSEPFVWRTNRDKWRMLYLSCMGWDFGRGKPESVYNIKYATSRGGMLWHRTQVASIPLSDGEGGIVRPVVLRRPSGGYRAWYSHRDKFDFRCGGPHSYRIGYAESDDGVRWCRLDEFVGIDVSDEGWDSEMIAYPWIYEHGGKLHMIYNGNGFGQSGMGHAWLEE